VSGEVDVISARGLTEITRISPRICAVKPTRETLHTREVTGFSNRGVRREFVNLKLSKKVLFYLLKKTFAGLSVLMFVRLRLLVLHNL
jgi:hypothetical protein